MSKTGPAGKQFQEYSPVVGRHESTRWVPTSTSYDGDGWGDEYDDADTVVRPANELNSIAEADEPVPGHTSAVKSPHILVDEMPGGLPALAPGANPAKGSESLEINVTPPSATTSPVQPRRSFEQPVHGVQGPQNSSIEHGYVDEPDKGEDGPPSSEASDDEAAHAKGDAHSIRSEDLSMGSDEDEKSREEDEEGDDYRDIYGYYDRPTHPYSELTKDEDGDDDQYMLDSDHDDASTKESDVPADEASELKEPPKVHSASSFAGNAEGPEPTAGFRDHAAAAVSHTGRHHRDDSGLSNSPAISQPSSFNQGPSGSIESSAAGAAQAALGHKKTPSLQEQQSMLEEQILGTLSPGHSRNMSEVSRLSDEEVEVHDPQLAELYQGTSEFLNRPISVYDNTQPLQLAHDESLKNLVAPREQLPVLKETPGHSQSRGTETAVPRHQTLEQPKGPLSAAEAIKNMNLDDDGEALRPRWTPLARSTQGSPEVAQEVPGGIGPDTERPESPQYSQVPEIAHTTQRNDSEDSLGRPGGPPAEDEPTQLVQENGDVAGTSGFGTRKASESNISQISTFSDNPALSNSAALGINLGSPEGIGGPAPRSRAGSQSLQQAQITAKVNRPPVVDFNALLKSGDSESRLAQVITLRSREAEYSTGLDTWLLAAYSSSDVDPGVFTSGAPPAANIRAVSGTRQVSSAVTSAMSSAKTKEAMASLGEKSTAKAKSLFGKGRKLIRSSKASSN